MPVRSVTDGHFGSSLANLYFRSLLDPLVELARAVCHDVVRRPRLYSDCPDELGGPLEGLRVRLGSDPDWPDPAQRAEIYWGFFGESFHGAASALRRAAVRRARLGDEGAGDDVFADAVAAFQDTLEFGGFPLTLADKRTENIYTGAMQVLREQSVAAVFGARTTLRGEKEDDLAVAAEIYAGLDLIELTPEPSVQRLQILERVAHWGAQTIVSTLRLSNDEQPAGDLAAHAMHWENARQELLTTVDVTRAWKDRDYRKGLSPGELADVARAAAWLSDPRDLPDDGLGQGPMLGRAAATPVDGWR